MIHGWSACGGPTMVRTTRDWEAELRGWLEPFLERLGHKARRRMCPLYVAGLIGPAIARAFSQWRNVLRRTTMISCTILLLVVSGIPRRWRENCSFKRIGLSAAAMRYW